MTLIRSRRASLRDRLPEARSLALKLVAGRSVIGAVIMAAPVPAARMLGADTATAQRVTWLTRMLGVRDGAIGVGGVDAVRRGTSATPGCSAAALRMRSIPSSWPARSSRAASAVSCPRCSLWARPVPRRCTSSL